MVKYETFLKAYREAHPNQKTKDQYSNAQNEWNEIKNNEKDETARNLILEQKVSEYQVKKANLDAKKREQWHNFMIPKPKPAKPTKPSSFFEVNYNYIKLRIIFEIRIRIIYSMKNLFRIQNNLRKKQTKMMKNRKQKIRGKM